MLTARERRVVPPALLLGAVCAFVSCCVAGRVLSRRNPFVDFQRFHHAISPQALFYPTASQVRALGRARLDRDRIAVVVGGSSVLRGAGQRANEVWTRHLQEELGDDYRVLNLAMDGAFPAEFGGTVAEILTRDFPRLLFVSDVFLGYALARDPVPGERVAAIPFGTRYPYFFLDATFKGLLPTDPARDEAIRARLDANADAGLAELVRGSRVDGLVYSRDLWTTLAYRHFFSVWSPAAVPFGRPRRSFPDAGEQPLLAGVRYTASAVKMTVDDLRTQIAAGKRLRQQVADGRKPEPNALLLFPPALHGRTLLIARRSSPDSMLHLRPEERAQHSALLTGFVRELQRAGFATVETGVGYAEVDYLDSCHLSESGGRKLAREVAPALHRQARRLGYVGAD